MFPFNEKLKVEFNEFFKIVSFSIKLRNLYGSSFKKENKHSTIIGLCFIFRKRQ